jgi:hypothetical protein
MGLILLDFDGTITQHDTLDALVSLAIAHSQAHHSSAAHPNTGGISTSTNSRSSSDEKTAVWRDIVREYVADHEAHVAAYSPPAHLRDTLAQELLFLESLGAVDERSVARVGKAGLFARLDGEQLEALGRGAVCPSPSSSSCSSSDGDGGENRGTVKLRKGFGRFVERMGHGGAEEGGGKGKGWDVGIVSVNWSARFIKGVVEAGCSGTQTGAQHTDQGGRFKLVEKRIVANGIRFPGGEVEGPAELGGAPLLTAGDKLRAMKSLRQGMEEEMVVYFGDSTTDLSCLVEADFGVVMADNDGDSKLMRTLRRVGLEVPHVDECGDGTGRKLAWARDFEEVLKSGVIERIGGTEAQGLAPRGST